MRLLCWPNEETYQSNIYVIRIYIHFHSERTLIMRPLSVLAGHMIKSVVLNFDRYTREFTLVGNWANSPEWHICNICHPRDEKKFSFPHVSDHFEHASIYFTMGPPASDMRYMQWQLWVTFYIYIYIYIYIWEYNSQLWSPRQFGECKIKIPHVNMFSVSRYINRPSKRHRIDLVKQI